MASSISKEEIVTDTGNVARPAQSPTQIRLSSFLQTETKFLCVLKISPTQDQLQVH